MRLPRSSAKHTPDPKPGSMKRAAPAGRPLHCQPLRQAARRDLFLARINEPVASGTSGADYSDGVVETRDVPAERHKTMRHSTTSFHAVELTPNVGSVAPM